MKKVNVYYLETEYRYWSWHEVFLELLLHLKKHYDTTVIHQRGGHLVIEHLENYHMPDCEIIIEDVETGALKAITFSESKTKLFDIFVNRNNPADTLLLTQFHNWFPKDFDTSGFNFTIKPTTFYTFSPTTNYDFFYHLRQFYNDYNKMIDQMFCLSTTGRPIVFQLREVGLISEATRFLTIEEYLDLAIRYKVGLSTTGVAEICHREIEYMAIGLPNIRMEYMTQLDPPLIPNYHYIAISREQFPWDSYGDRNGGPEYVEAYRKRYDEVRNDHEFLEFIAQNARNYYKQYCSPENRLTHVLNSLGIHEWK